MEQRYERYTHLRDYWRVVFKRKHLVLLSFVIVVSTVAFTSSKQVPIYSASCKIMLEYQKVEIDAFGGRDVIRKTRPAGREFYEAQYEIIRSYDVAKRAARMMGLDKKGNLDAAAKRVQRSVSIKPAAGQSMATSIAYIVSKSTDPKTAMEMANAVAQAYIKQREVDRQKILQDTYNAFMGQIIDAKDKLLKSEEALAVYKKESGIVTLSGDRVLGEEVKSEFNMNLSRIQAEIIEKKAFLGSIKETLPSDSVMALTVIAEKAKSGLVNIELKKQLFDYEQQLKELKLKYREKHPEIARLNQEIESIKEEIANEVERVMISLELELKTLKAKAENLVTFLSNPEGNKIDSVEYLSLSREVEVNKDIYTTLLKRLKEMGVSESLDKFPELKIIEPAGLPKRPMPIQKMNLLVSPVLGLLVGLGIALFLEYLDNSIKTVEDVHRTLDLPVLGIIPHISHSKRR